MFFRPLGASGFDPLPFSDGISFLLAAGGPAADVHQPAHRNTTGEERSPYNHDFMLGLPLLACVVLQDPGLPPQQPAPPRIEERVEVVGVTPIHGLGLDRMKVPGNVQVFTAGDLGTALALDVPTLLAERASSVHVNEVQAGTFQPDVVFRGFAASPLLGASEGIAVYQDGVRVNDPFGDVVFWDTLPPSAIASINLIPGSNPLFGLNALGGALSVRTKDGFDYAGRRLALTTGSFGRHRVEGEFGGRRGKVGYFATAAIVDEKGPRDFSPSTVRHVFADLSWRSSNSAIGLAVTGAANDLIGNGPAPVDLLTRDRRAVFTHPDRTSNDTALVIARGRTLWPAGLVLEAVAYFRGAGVRTFNADAAAVDDADDDRHDRDRYDAVNNTSRTQSRGGGFTGQVTRSGSLRGRANHLVAGAGIDAAGVRFDFAAEHAQLTDDRGTIASGLFDGDAAVDLRSAVTTASAFVTNAWSATETVTISGSARVNWTSLRLRDQIGTALTGDHRFARLNPAAGITWQTSGSANVYASYAQSSRVPTPVELTCADPEDPCRLPNAFVSDPPLRQIVAATWEAGVRDAIGPLRWGLAAFSTRSRDDIIFVSSGTQRGQGHFENVSATDRAGFEASLDAALRHRLSTFAAWTFQRAVFGTSLRIASPFHPAAEDGGIDVERGDRLPGVPAHTFKAGATAAFGRARVGVSLQYQSAQAYRGDEANLLPRVPGFTVVNAHGRARVTSRLTAVVQAHNVFDARYFTTGLLGESSIPGIVSDDPRFLSPGVRRAAWIGVEIR